MSVTDACVFLGVQNRTLYRFIDEGQVPAYKFGRVYRLRRCEVEDFIERCRVAPGTLAHLYPQRPLIAEDADGADDSGGGSADE